MKTPIIFWYVGRRLSGPCEKCIKLPRATEMPAAFLRLLSSVDLRINNSRQLFNLSGTNTESSQKRYHTIITGLDQLFFSLCCPYRLPDKRQRKRTPSAVYIVKNSPANSPNLGFFKSFGFTFVVVGLQYCVKLYGSDSK